MEWTSEDKQKWWDDQSDENKLEWSEDKQKWWDNQSDENKLEWSEDKQNWWEDQSDEYKLKWSEDRKQRSHDLPTEEGTITLLMEQMRMVRISSSLKYLVPMT